MGVRSQRLVAAGLAVLLVIGGVALLVSNIVGAGAGAGPATTTSAGCVLTSAEPPGAIEAGLPVVPLCALPVGAATVAGAIQAGGPFGYPQDGSTFGNAEQRLPARQSGYYREYTVPTPGSADRGAWRLIAGSGGEFYFTPDHYENFVVVDVKATGDG